MSTAPAEQVRGFTPADPCPICGGYERFPRGHGQRCHGFLSTDGRYAHCSREEHAGQLHLEPEANTYAHRLDGPCKCGIDHRTAQPSTAVNTQPHRAGRVIKAYMYVDEKSSPLFEVRRKEPKSFQQARIDPDGTRVCESGCMKGVRRVLYRLPDVVNAVAAGDRVYICEGEKDADRARDAGLVATTNPGGAGKWRDEYNDFLRSADVTIVRDGDAEGHRHAEKVAASLEGVTRSVQIVEPKAGKDLSDHLDAGHGIEELVPVSTDAIDAVTLRANATRQSDGGGVPDGPECTSEHFTDMGNASRFCALHGRDVRYCHVSKRWYTWDARVWRPDSTGELMRRAKATVGAIYAEAAQAPPETRKELAAHARRSESERQLKAMISLAASEPGIPISPDDLDQDSLILNAQNGTIDLRTGELRPHRRADLLTKMILVDYDPSGRSELFEGFLERIIPDASVRGFLQQAVGYSLTGLTTEQVLFLLWGGGSNGKTTFIETLLGLLGDYAIKTPAETLLAKRDTGIPNDVAALRGARFVAAVEMEEGRRLAEVRVKELTGGDTISARFMRGEWFTFRPACKVWLASNHRPVVRGTDHAIWRRLRLIPFTETITDSERDPHLIEKLKSELTGVLTWAVDGCLAWQREGLKAPDSVLLATQKYRQEQDLLGEFFRDRCVLDEGTWVSAADLYRAYCNWSEGDRKAMSKRELGIRLRERGFDDTRKGKTRTRAWLGIRLTEPLVGGGDHDG